VFNAGDFRHKIKFFSPPSGKRIYSALLDDWTEFKSVWASREPLLGRELQSALSADSKVEVKFRSRFVPGVTSDMRIKHGEEVYEIISALDVESAHRELLCYCRRVVELFIDGVIEVYRKVPANALEFLFTVPYDAHGLTVDEYFAARQHQVRSEFRVETPWDMRVNPEHIAVIGGVQFDVKQVFHGRNKRDVLVTHVILEEVRRRYEVVE